jgi:hypothetical protein
MPPLLQQCEKPRSNRLNRGWFQKFCRADPGAGDF